VIKKVIGFQNDMVMVFDDYGEQVCEYQGYYADVRERILTNAPRDAVFTRWFDDEVKPRTVLREAW